MKPLRFMYSAKRAHAPFKAVHLDGLRILVGVKETWFVEDDLTPCWTPTRVARQNPERVREALEKRHYKPPRGFTEKLAEAVGLHLNRSQGTRVGHPTLAARFGYDPSGTMIVSDSSTHPFCDIMRK
jgi:hypothetical protein